MWTAICSVIPWRIHVCDYRWLAAKIQRMSAGYQSYVGVDTASGAVEQLLYTAVMIKELAVNVMMVFGSSTTFVSCGLFKQIGK